MAEEPPKGSYTIKYVCMYVCKTEKFSKLQEDGKLYMIFTNVSSLKKI